MSSDGLRLEGVSKRWGTSVGVERVDLDVGKGEFIVLLGPSGCGKSTTLRLIAGLETPSSGRIWIGGREVTDLPPSKRGLSMVFQSYALFPHLTVAENIVFGLRVRKVAAEERRASLAEALRLTGLQGLEQRKPSELSGGQRQRVALARAIVATHPLCLMDEPLSNLDAKLRHAVRQDIRGLQRRLGMTVVYVTHDQTEAMAMADRVVLLNGGLVEQMGAPQELYARPATSFAAGFIGSPPMTLLPLAALPAGLRPRRLDAGLDVVVGVRPEDFEVAAAHPKRLPAIVRDCEFLGAETLVYLESSGIDVTARVPGRARVSEGEPVGLGWRPESAHLFDVASGKRIEDGGATSAPMRAGRAAVV
jgi:sn-glycerol 3-phosphate transport system ATP-binding protein